MDAAVSHDYLYPYPSQVEAAAAGPRLLLATSSGAAHPHFFSGQLTDPRRTAAFLRGLSAVVGARFYTPPNMLARILAEADPVVTCGGGLLRFECFSACCSAYARVDLEPDAYDGDVAEPGTTNVDFGPAMRGALSAIRDGEQVGLSVGADALTLERLSGQVVEKKVELPLRWLKGFVEVGAYQSRLRERLAAPRAEALRFLRALPRGANHRHETWVVPAGRGLRLTRRPDPRGVRVTGTERLRVLEGLVPLAERLVVYGSDDATSAWVLEAGPLRFALVLSPNPWRGFSGEGQVLRDLATGDLESALARVRSALTWQAELDPARLASELGLAAEPAQAALAALGSRGLVGFDVTRGAWFHRELPFDLSLVEALHPRLRNARKLVAGGGIELRREGEVVTADVPGSGCTHRVRLEADGARCTCPWFAKHQGARGPCKHVLAVEILAEGA